MWQASIVVPKNYIYSRRNQNMKKKLIAVTALAMSCAMFFTPVSHAAVADTTADSEDAAKGSATGSGEVEGIINKDIFKVVMPTDADTTNFAFILDPQGLIKATSSDTDKKHTESFEADASLFFKNSDGNYSHVSDPLSVTNKSTGIVDVTLTATAGDLKSASDAAEAYNINLAENSTFAENDSSTSIYLGLIAGDDAPIALTAKDGATVTKTLDAAPEGAYKTIYDTANSKYDYVLDSTFDASKFSALTFKMEGACNTNADAKWVESAAPGVEVAWTLEKHKVAPSAPETATFVKGKDTTISGISLGSGSLAATKATITVSKTDNKSGEYQPTTLPLNGNSVTIPGTSWGGAAIGDTRYLKVVFNDTAKTTKYIAITMTNEQAPSAPESATFTKGSDLTISGISLGAGSLAATTANITISKSDSTTGDYQTTALPLIDGSVTVPGSSWAGASAGDKRYLKLVFDDTATTTLYIELTIA